ncbi:MAG TPA: tetratricopeptide repeat protein [Bacteroidia bacterium]|nr:tetratricopeptide repeat protein [Bacteroidia bacterium]HRS58162.1 tetratricopeptide repeat protein [Bacteroidia bacterium]HRU67492.1 tetratricopeptide repeat protein [Bacteroidia bacterium]
MAAKKETSDAPFNIPIFTPENKTRLENFYQTYKTYITYGLGGILVILIGFFAFKNFILKPKEKEAQDMIFMAQQYFEKDSFEIALNGKDESFYGFLDVIDDYKMTKTGRLAHYYAGICYLRLGQYEDALHHLKKFRTHSRMLRPVSIGVTGDVYSELGEYKKAAKYYVKAATCVKNKLTTPMFYAKAALVYEELEQYKKALKYYELLKEEFPTSQEGINADKFIGRVKAKLEN